MLKITLRRTWQSAGGIQKHVDATCTWRIHEHFDGLAHQELADAGYVCVLVQATGDERDWIGRNYSGIPRLSVGSGIPSEKWRGDTAAFIYDHLPRHFDQEWGKDGRALDSF